jgi:hypothetical protein
VPFAGIQAAPPFGANRLRPRSRLPRGWEGATRPRSARRCLRGRYERRRSDDPTSASRRCRRPAPRSDEPAALCWELIAEHGEGVGVVCPDCLTLRHQRAIRGRDDRRFRQRVQGDPHKVRRIQGRGVPTARSARRPTFCITARSPRSATPIQRSRRAPVPEAPIIAANCGVQLERATLPAPTEEPLQDSRSPAARPRRHGHPLLASHARDRCGLLATQRPLDAVRPPPDRPHRSLRVKPLRGVNLLPTLDRRRVGDSGPAAAPEPAIRALREVAKRHSGGRDVPHMFPAPARRGRAREADLPS